MTDIALPSIPSQLLRISVQDCLKVEAQPEKFRLNMTEWMKSTDTGYCHVCMAGAVMAMTCEVVPRPNTIETPCSFTFKTEVTRRLWAIDYLRIGELLQACIELGDSIANMYKTKYELRYREIIGAELNDNLGIEMSSGFRADWDQYLRGAEYLESVGL